MVYAKVSAHLYARLAADARFRAILEQMAFPSSAHE
jgi:hypothetical protein